MEVRIKQFVIKANEQTVDPIFVFPRRHLLTNGSSVHGNSIPTSTVNNLNMTAGFYMHASVVPTIDLSTVNYPTDEVSIKPLTTSFPTNSVKSVPTESPTIPVKSVSPTRSPTIPVKSVSPMIPAKPIPTTNLPTSKPLVTPPSNTILSLSKRDAFVYEKWPFVRNDIIQANKMAIPNKSVLLTICITTHVSTFIP